MMIATGPLAAVMFGDLTAFSNDEKCILPDWFVDRFATMPRPHKAWQAADRRVGRRLILQLETVS